MGKKKTSKFLVSFEIEVEHAGVAADACEEIEDLVAEVVDSSPKWNKGKIKGNGIAITDTVLYRAEVE